ncbi:MAG: hypothetical protein ACRC1I_26665, partial [Pseudomonas proteolytica]|uniref:hypothetical protein n=1 Tax=Pseudomonas proteolytica TaxID=219574 RepID=UPI003F39121D
RLSASEAWFGSSGRSLMDFTLQRCEKIRQTLAASVRPQTMQLYTRTSLQTKKRGLGRVFT